MHETDQAHFTIIGSGLAGALLACHLGQSGYRVDLFEKRSDPRRHEQDRGRSINLALSVRGLEALREVGLAERVLQASILMRGRMMHAPSGRLTFQPYGKDDTEAIHSVSRADLNRLLVEEAAQHDGVRMYFGHPCRGIDLKTSTVELVDVASGEIVRRRCLCVIGADGAFSVVRGQLQRQEGFNYRQDYLEYGYRELHIPSADGGGFRMDKNALHIWPRKRFMMIALPNPDGSFTATLFLPYRGPNGFESLQDADDVRRYFEERFPDALPLMPTLMEDYFQNPLGSLVTIRCSPWHVGGRVALVGDACHAVVPFLGQGMNAAFEDCTVLSRCLKRNAPAWEAAFAEYEVRRKPHTDALAELCLVNFIEMRDKVGSRLFLLRKRFDNMLHKLLPFWYLPLYTMVSFSTIPYADAVRRARQQNRIVAGGLVLILFGLFALLGWVRFGF
jgi:kynurenine 3-monooxygenase